MFLNILGAVELGTIAAHREVVGKDLLGAQNIWDALPGRLRNHFAAIEWHERLPSTQDALMARSRSGRDMLLCAAKMQTAGRGRQGRWWQHAQGQIALSWRGLVSLPTEYVGLLSLAACMALIDALSGRTQLPLQVKWPNDVYIFGKGKLAGFLIDLVSQRQAGFDIVLGMGLNRLRDALPPEGAALEEVMTTLPDQAELISWFLTHWLAWLHALASESGRQAVRVRWQSSALWLNEEVEVIQSDHRWRGVMTGIDAYGRLRLQTAVGEMVFSAGDIRLRGRSIADQ